MSRLNARLWIPVKILQLLVRMRMGRTRFKTLLGHLWSSLKWLEMPSGITLKKTTTCRVEILEIPRLWSRAQSTKDRSFPKSRSRGVKVQNIALPSATVNSLSWLPLLLIRIHLITSLNQQLWEPDKKLKAKRMVSLFRFRKVIVPCTTMKRNLKTVKICRSVIMLLFLR